MNGKIHFIGAGGASISVLVRIAKSLGAEVSACDRVFGSRIEKLKAEGYDVYVGHRPEAVAGATEVVYSGAVPKENVEIKAAEKLGIKTTERGEFLGRLSKSFDRTVAVAGTHGKTTVSGLIASCYRAAGQNFCAHVGGDVVDFDGGFYFSGTDTLVTEACEYRKSFLSLHPSVAVVLNVEPDHSDTYANRDELFASFERFVGNAFSSGGIAVMPLSDKFYHMHKWADGEVLTYGIGGGADVCAENFCLINGKPSFDAVVFGKHYGHVDCALFGEHNAMNALACIAACVHENIDKYAVLNTLTSFRGIKCRYEHICTVNGNSVVSDYAHHPSEIAALVRTARTEGKKTVLCFQPHTYMRTAALFDGFVSALSEADEIFLVKTYSVREGAELSHMDQKLFDALPSKKKKCLCADVWEAAERIKCLPPDSCTVLTAGAGDITEIGKFLQ